MFITITTVQQKANDTEKVEKFLTGLLPRLEKFPGIVATYNYVRPEHDDNITLLIWESKEAWNGYMESPLKGEVEVFMQENDLTLTREMYPLAFAGMGEKMGAGMAEKIGAGISEKIG